MIPEAAVEAALAEVPRLALHHINNARLRNILEAGATDLLAEAWNLGLAAGIRCERGQIVTNPYRTTK